MRSVHGNGHRLRSGWHGVVGYVVEAGASAHGLDFALRERVSRRGGCEHGHGEHTGARGRDVIVVDGHFHDRHFRP